MARTQECGWEKADEKACYFWPFSLAAAISAATGAAKPAKVGAAGPAGSSAYSAKCAACHGAKLEGGFGPPLSGSGFKAKWSAKGLASLANYIKANMPPSDAGSLSAAQANQLAAMIGTKNGIIPKAAVKAVGSSPVPSPVSNSKKGHSSKKPMKVPKAELDRLS
ncbi:c-type cytochrome [Novosphingobium colocasiae]